MVVKKATLDGHTLIVDGSFGNPNVRGNQLKQSVDIGRKNYYFAKSDAINPEAGTAWNGDHNVHYSSVSEALVGCVVRSMKADERFICADYEFVNVRDSRGETHSGTISNNYLDQPESHKIEIILGSQQYDATGSSRTMIDVRDLEDAYGSEIMDAKTADSRIARIASYFQKEGCAKEDAERFLVQQAGFDVLFGNTDRLGNPGNFVLSKDEKTGESTPINMDFGRCLNMMWSDTAEQNFDPAASYYGEMVSDFSEDILRSNNSILRKDLQGSIAWLKEHGFEPFEIDMDALEQEIQKTLEAVNESPESIQHFAKVKADVLLDVLLREDVKDLVRLTDKEMLYNNERDVLVQSVEINQTDGLTL